MVDHNEQIEMLNAAKADVQKQLDTIFAEECEKLISSVSCLSQIDAERMAQFLAQTIYECFNSQDEVIRSNVIESFSSAFGAMVEGAVLTGKTGWDAEEATGSLQSEMPMPTEAA